MEGKQFDESVQVMGGTLLGHVIGTRGVLAICAVLKRQGIMDDGDVRFVIKKMREAIPDTNPPGLYDPVRDAIAKGESEIATIPSP